jgi:transposase InsO family protein
LFLFGLVILCHNRRRLVHISVNVGPTADLVVRQITESFPWDAAPKHIIRDRDGAYGVPFRRHLGAMSIRDRPTAPWSPWYNGYVEHLIGSIRRECLDHMVAFGEAHLRRVLAAYAYYYNGTRTHQSLGEDTPFPRQILREGQIKSVPHLGGLHHSYVRMQFAVGAGSV